METLDRQRERWRQARHELRLADPVDEQFGLGGLGGRVRGLTARVVILPADPFAHRLDFDEDFWKLWMKEIRGPFEGRELRWGSLEAPTPYSAVRCEDGSENAWRRYGALSHSGLLDIGLGEDGGWRGGAKEWKGICHLLPVVATAWEACHAYGQLSDRFGFERPWELSIGICRTAGTVLGGFARGWNEPNSWYSPRLCKDANILLRREVFDTPEGWCKSTAFSIGSQIENAFGSKYQRYRMITDGNLGDFDFETWR
jgi:hypothetical protein